MKPEFFHDHAIIPALSLLPERMDSPAGRAMILAICLQESDIRHRAQIGGPARGYPMFELHSGALLDVLNKPSTRQAARELCVALDVALSPEAIYRAIEYNDILAAGVTRLFLWGSPRPLSGPDDPNGAYQTYLAIWRPGKLSPERWPMRYAAAWSVVFP